MRWFRGVINGGALFGLLIFLRLASFVSAQGNATCLSLQHSTMCSNFSTASISTGLTTDFPFLQFVQTVEDFDKLFTTYIQQDYAKKKYQQVLQCENINLANTTYLYARFTATVLCAQIIQESIQSCGLNSANAPPVCASTCADFATSEEVIVMTDAFCGGNSTQLTDSRISLIRADFTVCALPANSLSASCIGGLENEPENCGFGTNLPQLCTYCGRTSPNATSFCCLSSNLTACSSINIPPTRTLPAIFTSTATVTSAPTNGTSTSTSVPATGSSNGLSTGVIVGIAIAAAAAGLIAAALILFCCLRRRRTDDEPRSLRPRTSTVPMSCGPFPERNGYSTIDDDSRVRRMAAMAGSGGVLTSPEVTPPRAGERSRRNDHSSSDESPALSSPEPGGSPVMAGTLPPPPPRGGVYGSGPVTPPRSRAEREAALAAGAAAVGAAYGSGNGGRGESMTMSTLSPGTEASEAASVSTVVDPYSLLPIHQQSDVAALWTYLPRMDDEMPLDRGDVVRIENLYDDGWALGRKLKTKIWDMVDDRSTERDSGIGTSQRASGSTARRGSSDSPAAEREPPSTSRSDKGKEKEVSEMGPIRAFPMVCVCHRDAWGEVLAREAEQSLSPTPDLGGRRISPTRLDLGVHEQDPTPQKESRFDPLSSSEESPDPRGRGMAPGPIRDRSSSQGSRFREDDI